MEESEREIEDDDELEDSDGLYKDDVWEEEEEEGEEQGVESRTFDQECIHDDQGVEPQTFDQGCIHDNQEEEHRSPQPCDDLNRVVGHCNMNLDDQRGYLWDDYDEGSSADDSSSEDNPVINSHFGEQFEMKWEELSNSVTTLSPLKQLPVKSSPPQTTSQSSKKRLILAPRTTPTSSQSLMKTAQYTNDNTPAISSTDSASNNQSTGLSHLRDGMSLLELYGSKGHPVSAPTESTLSLVHRLSSGAESANKRPSHSRSSNKKTNLWTLQHSAHAKSFVDTAGTSATSSMTQLDCDVSKQISSTDPPPRQPDAKPHPPSIQAPSNPTSKTVEYRPHTLTDSVNISNSILATLDHETNTSQKQEDTDSSKSLMVNFDSDIDLLSQEEPNMSRYRGSSVSMATTSRGRSLLRRGRGRVHSTAAVISEVEQLGHGGESDRHSEPGGKARDCGVGKDREMDERERKVISSGHKR